MGEERSLQGSVRYLEVVVKGTTYVLYMYYLAQVSQISQR